MKEEEEEEQCDNSPAPLAGRGLYVFLPDFKSSSDRGAGPASACALIWTGTPEITDQESNPWEGFSAPKHPPCLSSDRL